MPPNLLDFSSLHTVWLLLPGLFVCTARPFASACGAEPAATRRAIDPALVDYDSPYREVITRKGIKVILDSGRVPDSSLRVVNKDE